jgi:hypothetical protein
VAAATGFTESAADTTANALGRLAAAFTWLQCIQLHNFFTFSVNPGFTS